MNSFQHLVDIKTINIQDIVKLCLELIWRRETDNSCRLYT